MQNYSGIDGDLEFIRTKLEDGYSAYKLSKILPYSKPTILRFIKDNNLVNQNKSKVDKKNMLKDKKEQVIKLHKEGKTQTEISKILGHSQGRINCLLKSMNYTEVNSNYTVLEDFFQKIDTEEKAYILGWFYSDGCVDDGGKARIQIQKEDEDILYRIKEILNYEGPIYEIPPPKKYPHRKAQVSLTINRKVLCDDLIRWGCMPNKSLILKYPVWIDKNLENHFIRGVFDGDGSVSLKKGKYLSTSITTTDIFNIELSFRLKSYLGVDSQIYYRQAGKNTCSLQITKSEYAKAFLSYIYDDSSIHLQRKFNVYNTL